MDKQQHTAEPWIYKGDGLIESCDGDAIAAFSHAYEESPIPIDEANARRIVACVNACDSVSNEALDNICVVDLIEAEQQRDKLLAAAEATIDFYGAHGGPMADLRAIIAEIEAGK